MTTRNTQAYASHLVFFVVLALIIPYGTLASAQVGAAAISGIVQDQTGAAVGGATVALNNSLSGVSRIAKSNEEGAFSFAAVQSGDYDLIVDKAGFAKFVQTGIHLNPGDSTSLHDVTLAVGGESQSVTVEATVAGLPLDSGQLSSTIGEHSLEQLSVVGRDATELTKTLPDLQSAHSAPPIRRRTSPKCRSVSKPPTLPMAHPSRV